MNHLPIPDYEEYYTDDKEPMSLTQMLALIRIISSEVRRQRDNSVTRTVARELQNAARSLQNDN